MDPPGAEDVGILLPKEGDTLYMFTRTQLQYDLNLGAEIPVGLEVFLNDVPVTAVSPQEYAFYVDPRTLPTGFYPLRLELTTTGGTGSLADRSGLEMQKVKKEWVIYMDKTAPEKVVFKDIYPESGTLMLSWTTYPEKNFQAYEIRKFCYDEVYEKYHPCDTLTVTRLLTTQIADSSFVGGKALYKIRVYGSDQYSAYSEKEYTFEYDPDFKWRWLTEKDIAFSWEPNPFYNNIKQYEFNQRYTNGSSINQHFGDTLHYYSFEFGEMIQYELKVVAKSAEERNDQIFYTDVYKGEKVPRALANSTYRKSTDKYYFLQTNWYGRTDTLFMFHGQTNEFEKKLVLGAESGFTISPNGKWAYVAYDDQLLHIDPSTLTVLQSYSIADLPGVDPSINEYYSLVVNNGNFLTMQLNSGYVVVDMSSFTIQHNTFDKIDMVSPDGNTLYKEGISYSWNGREYLPAGPFYKTEKLRAMVQFAEDSIVLWYTDTFKIIDAQSGSEIKSVILNFDWTRENIVSYDPVNHLLGQYFKQNNSNLTEFEVLNLATDEVRTILVADSRTYSFKILNNKLICSKGYQYSLE